MLNYHDQSLDFNLINIQNDKELSLLIRVGYLFNVNEIFNTTFITFGLEFTGKHDFIISAIQVALSVQTDVMLLTTLYQTTLNKVKGPINFPSFIELFNILRQEKLTQVNQPLLIAVSLCKRSNRSLQH